MHDPYIPDPLLVHDPSLFAKEPWFRIDPEKLPKTTTRRSSGFSVEEDIPYQIAVAHYGFTGTRGEFWHNTDTATKRLRKEVFGIRPPTPDQLFGLVTSGVPGHRYRDNTRATQKKKLKRRKQVMRKHRR